MSLSPLQQTMATLRIALAELQHKERQMDAVIQQYRTQLRRLPRQVIYGKTSLDLSLSAMAEIEERLADALAARRRLLVIKRTALEELEALELIKRVDEARSKLENLKRQWAADPRLRFRRTSAAWRSSSRRTASEPSGPSLPAIRSGARQARAVR